MSDSSAQALAQLVACNLQLHLVPYQGRHSGASIDRSERSRSSEEVTKRGRWKQFKNVARYEKAARLAATDNALSQAQRTHCMACERHLADFILGRRCPTLQKLFHPNRH